MGQYDFAIASLFLGLAYILGSRPQERRDGFLALVWLVCAGLWLLGALL